LCTPEVVLNFTKRERKVKAVDYIKPSRERGTTVETLGIACCHRGSSLTLLVKVVTIEGMKEMVHRKGHTVLTE